MDAEDLADYESSWPSTDPIDRLRHTVATFKEHPSEEFALVTQREIFRGGRTAGLTHGDLRVLLARLGG